MTPRAQNSAVSHGAPSTSPLCRDAFVLRGRWSPWCRSRCRPGAFASLLRNYVPAPLPGTPPRAPRSAPPTACTLAAQARRAHAGAQHQHREGAPAASAHAHVLTTSTSFLWKQSLGLKMELFKMDAVRVFSKTSPRVSFLTKTVRASSFPAILPTLVIIQLEKNANLKDVGKI